MPTDITRSGSKNFTREQQARVLDYLEAHAGAHGVTRLARELGIPGRTIRSIVSDADGRTFATIAHQRGVGIARTFEEVETGNKRIRSQMQSLERRLIGRMQFAALPRIQGRFDI